VHTGRIAVFLTLSVLVCRSVFAASAPPANPKFDFVQQDGGIAYAAPKSGPLRFKTFEQEGARFAGRIRLTGTYLYGHSDADPNAELVDEPDLYFLPDDATRAMLPFWYERGPVVEVYFENPDAFLRAVVAPDVIARVKQHKVHAVTGHAVIWVDNYSATAECDHPEYTVRFLNVDTPPALVARNEFVEQLGCG
jgi:hypothetical protein